MKIAYQYDIRAFIGDDGNYSLVIRSKGEEKHMPVTAMPQVATTDFMGLMHDLMFMSIYKWIESVNA